MPTSRFRNETLLYNSDETELLSRVRVRPGSGDGAWSSVESSLSMLLRKLKKKKKEMLFTQTASIVHSTPKRPLAVTPKVCHLFGQSQKEREDRQGTVAAKTCKICAPGNHFAQDSPCLLKEPPALQRD